MFLSSWDHAINFLFISLKDIINPVQLAIGGFLICIAFLSCQMHNLTYENAKAYKNKAVFWSLNDSMGKPSGLIIGKWFIGFDGRDRFNRSTTVFTFGKTHNRICKIEGHQKNSKVPPETFECFNKSGTLSEMSYVGISAKITESEPRPFQELIVNRIRETYEKKNNAVVVISGRPGTGKSYVHDQLIRSFAKDNISCMSTDDFRPTEPSDLFQSLYAHTDPSDESPLIVQMDEFDGILRDITYGKINPHPKFLIQVKNKNDWNTFLDKIEKGRYKHTIFILTTNLPLSAIDEFDASFTRPGRIDHRFEVSTCGSLAEQKAVLKDGGLVWI